MRSGLSSLQELMSFINRHPEIDSAAPMSNTLVLAIRFMGPHPYF